MPVNLRNVRTSSDALPKIEDFFKVLPKEKLAEGLRIRLIGPLYEYHIHNVEGLSNSGKKFFYSVPCINWDPEENVENPSKGCPYCRAGVKMTKRFFSNILLLDEINDPRINIEARTASEKEVKVLGDAKFFVKDMESRSFTPVQVLSIPGGLVGKLKSIEDTNYTKDAEGHRIFHPINDLKYGKNLLLRYDANAKSPNERYILNLDPESERFSPIENDVRKSILLYDLSAGVKSYSSVDTLTLKIEKDISKITNADHPEVYLKENSATKSIATFDTEDVPAPVVKKVANPLDDDLDVPEALTPVNLDDMDDIPF